MRRRTVAWLVACAILASIAAAVVRQGDFSGATADEGSAQRGRTPVMSLWGAQRALVAERVPSACDSACLAKLRRAAIMVFSSSTNVGSAAFVMARPL
jgi:hypothetical protein